MLMLASVHHFGTDIPLSASPHLFKDGVSHLGFARLTCGGAKREYHHVGNEPRAHGRTTMGMPFMKQGENGFHPSRREFVKMAAAGAGVLCSGAMVQAEPPALASTPNQQFASPPLDHVRVGYVGIGGMGSNHVRNLLRIDGVELRAVCDILPEKVAYAQKLAVAAGQKEPSGYTRGEYDFKRMCAEEDLDLVYTATPWEWHAPICVAAMENGKHAATEVPATVTLEECWQLVETAEKYRKHCVMMENCCYDRPEMMVLNMVRHGLFGELIHGECGYLHDLRDVKFGLSSEGLWRRAHAMKRDGNLYPTHGIGPIAQYMNINRGDQFAVIVSMSSKSRGLQDFAKEHLKENDPRRQETYKLGDVNVSLIKTVNGLTITIVHDTNLPRPYSRINMIQGTRGVFAGYPDRVFIEGRSKKHEFEKMEAYQRKFDHPLWKANDKAAKGAGHGGMDYLEDMRLIECLRHGWPLDMNVYDAAAWTAIGPLSEQSVAKGSAPIDVPDFTRGGWKTAPMIDPVALLGQKNVGCRFVL